MNGPFPLPSGSNNSRSFLAPPQNALRPGYLDKLLTTKHGVKALATFPSEVCTAPNALPWMFERNGRKDKGKRPQIKARMQRKSFDAQSMGSSFLVSQQISNAETSLAKVSSSLRSYLGLTDQKKPQRRQTT